MEKSRLPRFGRKARLPVPSHSRADIIRPHNNKDCAPPSCSNKSSAVSSTDHEQADHVNCANGQNNEEVSARVRTVGRNNRADGAVNVPDHRGSDSASIHGGSSDCPQLNNGPAQSADTIGAPNRDLSQQSLSIAPWRNKQDKCGAVSDDVFFGDKNVTPPTREMFSSFGKGSKGREKGKLPLWQLGGKARKLPDPPKAKGTQENVSAPRGKYPPDQRNQYDSMTRRPESGRDLPVPPTALPLKPRNPTYDSVDVSERDIYRSLPKSDSSRKALTHYNNTSAGHYKELDFSVEKRSPGQATSPETNKGYVDVQIPNPEITSRGGGYAVPNKQGPRTDWRVPDEGSAPHPAGINQSYKLVNKPGNSSVSRVAGPCVNTGVYQPSSPRAPAALPSPPPTAPGPVPGYGYSMDGGSRVPSVTDYQDNLDDSFEHIYEEPLSPGQRTSSASSEGALPSPLPSRRPFTSPTCGIRMAELRASKRQKSPSPEPLRNSPLPGTPSGSHYGSNESMGSQYSSHSQSKMNTIREEGDVVVHGDHVYHLYSASLSRQAKYGRSISLGSQNSPRLMPRGQATQRSSSTGHYEGVIPASHLAATTGVYSGKNIARDEGPQAGFYPEGSDLYNDPRSHVYESTNMAQHESFRKRETSGQIYCELSSRQPALSKQSSVPRSTRSASGSGSHGSNSPVSSDCYSPGQPRPPPSPISSPQLPINNVYGASDSSAIEQQSKSSGSSATLTICSANEDDHVSSGDLEFAVSCQHNAIRDTKTKSRPHAGSSNNQEYTQVSKPKVLLKKSKLGPKGSPHDVSAENKQIDNQRARVRDDSRRWVDKGDNNRTVSPPEAPRGEEIYSTPNSARAKISQAQQQRGIQRVETFSSNTDNTMKGDVSEGVYDTPWDLKPIAILNSPLCEYQGPISPKSSPSTPSNMDNDQHLMDQLNQISRSCKLKSPGTKVSKAKAGLKRISPEKLAAVESNIQKRSNEKAGAQKPHSRKYPLLRNVSQTSDRSSSLSSSLNSSRASIASASSESDASQDPVQRPHLKKKTKRISKLRAPVKNNSRAEDSTYERPASSHKSGKSSKHSGEGQRRGEGKARGGLSRQSSGEGSPRRIPLPRQGSHDSQSSRSSKSGTRSLNVTPKTSPDAVLKVNAAEQFPEAGACDVQRKGSSHVSPPPSRLCTPTALTPKFAHTRSLTKLKLQTFGDESAAKDGNAKTAGGSKLKKAHVATRSTGTQFEKMPFQERIMFPSKKVLDKQGQISGGVSASGRQSVSSPADRTLSEPHTTHQQHTDKQHKSLPHKDPSPDNKPREGASRTSKLRPPSMNNKMQSASDESASVNTTGRSNNAIDKGIDSMNQLNQPKTDNDDCANDTERQQTVTNKDHQANLHEGDYRSNHSAAIDNAVTSSVVEISESANSEDVAVTKGPRPASGDEDNACVTVVSNVLVESFPYPALTCPKVISPTDGPTSCRTKPSAFPAGLVKPYASLNRAQPFVPKFTALTKVASPTEQTGSANFSQSKSLTPEGGKGKLTNMSPLDHGDKTPERGGISDCLGQVIVSESTPTKSDIVSLSHSEKSANHQQMCLSDEAAQRTQTECVPNHNSRDFMCDFAGNETHDGGYKKDRDSGYVAENEHELSTVSALDTNVECLRCNLCAEGTHITSNSHQNKHHPSLLTDRLAPDTQGGHLTPTSNCDKLKNNSQAKASSGSEDYHMKDLVSGLGSDCESSQETCKSPGSNENTWEISRTSNTVSYQNSSQEVSNKYPDHHTPTSCRPGEPSVSTAGTGAPLLSNTNIDSENKLVNNDQSIISVNSPLGNSWRAKNVYDSAEEKSSDSGSQATIQSETNRQIDAVTCKDSAVDKCLSDSYTQKSCGETCVTTSKQNSSICDKREIKPGRVADKVGVNDSREVNSLSTIQEDSSVSCLAGIDCSAPLTPAALPDTESGDGDKTTTAGPATTTASSGGKDSCQNCHCEPSSVLVKPNSSDNTPDRPINNAQNKTSSPDSPAINNNVQTSPSRNIRKVQNVEIRALRCGVMKPRNVLPYPCHSLPRKIKISAFDFDDGQSLSDTECNAKDPEISPRLRAKLDHEYQRRRRELCGSQETLPFGDPSFSRDPDSNEHHMIPTPDMWEIFRDHLGHHGIGIGNIRLSESGYDSWKSQDSGSTIYAQHDSQDESTSESSSRRDPDSEVPSNEGSLSRKEITNLKKEQANSESTICSTDSLASGHMSSVKDVSLKSSSGDTLLATDQEAGLTDGAESGKEQQPLSKVTAGDTCAIDDCPGISHTSAFSSSGLGGPVPADRRPAPQCPDRSDPRVGQTSAPSTGTGDLVNVGIDDGSSTPVNQNNPKLFAKTDSDETLKEDDILLDSEANSDVGSHEENIPAATEAGEARSRKDNLSPCELASDSVASKSLATSTDISSSGAQVDSTGIKDICSNPSDGVDRGLDIFHQPQQPETDWCHRSQITGVLGNKKNTLQFEASCNTSPISKEGDKPRSPMSDEPSVTHVECAKSNSGQDRLDPAPPEITSPPTAGSGLGTDISSHEISGSASGQAVCPQQDSLSGLTCSDDNSQAPISSSTIMPGQTSTEQLIRPTDRQDAGLSAGIPVQGALRPAISGNNDDDEPTHGPGNDPLTANLEIRADISRQDSHGSQDGYETVCEEYLEAIDSNRSSNSESSACQSTDSLGDAEMASCLRATPPQSLGPILPVLHLNDMPLYLRPETSPQRSSSSPDLPTKKIPGTFLTGESTLKRSQASSALNVDNNPVDSVDEGSMVRETAVSETSLHVFPVGEEDHPVLSRDIGGSDHTQDVGESDVTGGELTESDTSTLSSDASARDSINLDNVTISPEAIAPIKSNDISADSRKPHTENAPEQSSGQTNGQKTEFMSESDKKRANVRDLITRLEKKYNFDQENGAASDGSHAQDGKTSPESKIPSMSLGRKTGSTIESRLPQFGKTKPPQETSKLSKTASPKSPSIKSPMSSPTKGKFSSKKSEPSPSPSRNKQTHSSLALETNRQLPHSTQKADEGKTNPKRGLFSPSSHKSPQNELQAEKKSPVIARSKLGRPLRPRQDVSASQSNLSCKDPQCSTPVEKDSSSRGVVSSMIKHMTNRTDTKSSSRLPKSDAQRPDANRSGKEYKQKSAADGERNKGATQTSRRTNNMDTSGASGISGDSLTGSKNESKIPTPGSQSRSLQTKEIPRRTNFGLRKAGALKSSAKDKM